jgi:hypothetical protein
VLLQPPHQCVGHLEARRQLVVIVRRHRHELAAGGAHFLDAREQVSARERDVVDVRATLHRDQMSGLRAAALRHVEH